MDEYDNGSISEAAFVSAVDVLDRLLRISMKIRNPRTRTGSSKAFQYTNVDPDTGVNLIDRYYDYDKSHVKEFLAHHCKDRIIETEDHFLLERLARANMRRRQQFAYWSYHKLNLVRRSEETREKLITAVNRDLTIPRLAFATPMTDSMSEHSRPTTATHLDASKIKLDDAESVISTVSAYLPSTAEGVEDIPIPGPPEKFTSQIGLEEFECPYCFTICSKRDLLPSAWK